MNFGIPKGPKRDAFTLALSEPEKAQEVIFSVLPECTEEDWNEIADALSWADVSIGEYPNPDRASYKE